jgi:hypothetical protein
MRIQDGHDLRDTDSVLQRKRLPMWNQLLNNFPNLAFVNLNPNQLNFSPADKIDDQIVVQIEKQKRINQ